MNLPMKQKQTPRHRAHTCGCHGARGGRGMEWEFGISRCKLLYNTGNNKALSYSTGNCIEYPVKNNTV